MQLANSGPSAFQSLIPVETLVYNAASPTAWTDLDLSGTVGAVDALVFIKISQGSTSGNVDYRFRKNGESNSIIRGVSCAYDLNLNERAYVWVPVASGICEWISDVASTTVLRVLGWLCQYE